LIKIRDVAFVRFSAPDLDQTEQFLNDFGLVTTARSDTTLHVRGTDPEPYLHVTERGEAGFCGVAFEAASAEDLAAAAQLDGASEVLPLREPGGGQCVRFDDPDGFSVEVVHGRELQEPLPVRTVPLWNYGSRRERFGALQRFEAGPTQAKRLGHVVIRVTDFRNSEAWYKQRFGFVSSDEVHLGDPEKVLAAFMRCDLGEQYVDHHTFVCMGAAEPGFEHAAFEVEDVDAVMLGHDHLKTAGYSHAAGIGRHVLGSQVFDYWRDPWGNVLEHFTDGDLLNIHHETGSFEPSVVLGTQWGRFAVD
jgi:catechol 2,3-dioxygenase-like lactoylglutathione lyase family enzyme